MKILLVEDARSVAALMAARLTSFGHEVELAENGQAAVDRFSSTAPDLVLMDIEMPVMNGFEATSRIRAFETTQKWAWTPILFLTASDSEENLVTAIEAGGDDFLSKTVSEPVLKAKMKAMSRIAAIRQRLSFANRKLEELASRDGLTGLWNRRHMDLHADSEWMSASGDKRSFGLLMLDVDNFKKYNDHYGHPAGDGCLRAIAHAIEAVVAKQPAAFAARYGGEEFAVVLPGISQADYEALAAAIVAAVRDLGIPHAVNGEWGRATVSIGGSRFEQAEGRIATLFRTADERLYRAKQRGRNRAELD